MDDAIRDALGRVEAEEGVRVLLAVESGSRAWGFASPDSDYDVRFVYARPVEAYLSVRERRDTIEAMLPSDLDLAGWDLRKALGLLGKSNPSILEWLGSPLVYAATPGFPEEARALAASYLSTGTLWRHYVSMARTNARTYLWGESVPRKKYLYVMRPVLAARWIERGYGMPPTPFAELRARTLEEPEVGVALDRLLRDKAVEEEMSLAPRDPALHPFLEAEVARLSAVPMEKAPVPPTEALDAFFRRWIAS